MQLRAGFGPQGGGVATCRTPRQYPTGLPPSYVGLGDVLPQHGRPDRRARLLLREPFVQVTLVQVLRTWPLWTTLFPMSGWVGNPQLRSTASPTEVRPIPRASRLIGVSKNSWLRPRRPRVRLCFRAQLCGMRFPRILKWWATCGPWEMFIPSAVIAKFLPRRPMNSAFALDVDFANLLPP